jgi:uncharacterized membrane protein YhaH (DUF805 family)
VSGDSLVRRAYAPFSGLLDFGGRMAPRDFWPFMLLVIGIWLVGYLAMLAATGTFSAFAVFQITIMSLPIRMPLVDGLHLLLVLLTGSAVIRRLHDSGLSAIWWIIYLLLNAGHFALAELSAPVFGAHGHASAAAKAYFDIFVAENFLLHVCFIMLFVMCLQRGTFGPNRYGPDPRNEVVS